MVPVTGKQIEQAKSMDLLAYLLSSNPHSIRKSGVNEYCLKEHDSLKISSGRWNWFSHGFGGYSALDFLVKVRGMGFVDAVNHLTDGESKAIYKSVYSPPRISKRPTKLFTLPSANINNDRVIAYLRGRGIDKDIINSCIENGTLYESAKSHKYSIQLGRDFVWEKCGSILGENDRGKNINRAMHMMTDFQRYGMIFKQHNVRLEGFSDEYASLFENFLASMERRGIAASSIRKYRNFLFRFEYFLKNRGVERFNQLELYHVNAYVETLAGLAQNTVSASLSNLRQIMDFAKEKGYHHTSFAAALPLVRYRQTKRLPAVFSSDEVERIVANIDTSNPLGKRNYAIILTAAKLGLRVSDILGLNFNAFDWMGKKISICQQKTGVPLDLHLPEDVGWAIIEYLKHGRPESNSKTIFVSHHAPYDSMTSHFGKEIARAVQKTGVKVPADKVIGMHTFRHSLATSMLNTGATLSEIAQVLGHARIETSQEYISLSVDLLRECALEVSF